MRIIFLIQSYLITAYSFYLTFSFQQNLIAIKDRINQRNNKILEETKDDTCKTLLQEYPYEWLNPDNVRNSISI